MELEKWFESIMGYHADLSFPRTLNEKIQWLKINDCTELKTQLTDKYRAREWVSANIGGSYLVPLLGVWDDADSINFDELPEKFVLKTNHGCGYNVIVTDKKAIDEKEIRNRLNHFMSIDYAFQNGFEMQYHMIPRKIIAEEYLESDSDGIIDYRIFCFNGSPYMVWVDQYSGMPNHVREIFDLNWNKIPVQCKWPSANGKLDRKPATLDEMIEISKNISSHFYLVRVDFFEVGSKLYLGEMTFTSMSGVGKFNPPAYDRLFGDQLRLPTDG